MRTLYQWLLDRATAIRTAVKSAATLGTSRTEISVQTCERTVQTLPPHFEPNYVRSKELFRRIYMNFRGLIPFAILACASLPVCGQSLCDLVPATIVQSKLGLNVQLTATPNTSGGNGCDYKGVSTGPVTVSADASSYTGVNKTIFDQRMHNLGSTEQLVSGIGDAAYYGLRQNQQIPKYFDLTYTQQSIVFRAKGKIVNFTLLVPGNGVPKASMLALANYAISRPIEALKDPN